MVTKKWDDANDRDGLRPDRVFVTLTGTVEGSETPVYERTFTLSETNDWTALVRGVAKYADGKQITYTWTEDTIEGYDAPAIVQGRSLESFSNAECRETVEAYITVVTNTHVPERTSLEADKVWEDNNNQDGKRTGVVLQLTGTYTDRDGIVHTVAVPDSVRIIAANASGEALKVKWDDLFVKENGYTVHYAVTELGSSAGRINMNGAEYTVTVDPDAGLTAVPGYAGKITVTNSWTPEVKQLTVQKIWDDAEDQDGKRPASLPRDHMKIEVLAWILSRA